MSRLALPLLLALALGLPLAISGCLGDVQAVYVPASAVPEGWTHAVVNDTQEAANGMVEIKVNRYSLQGDLVADVYLVGVTDVPGVDEHKEIEKQIEAHADNQHVTLSEGRSFTFTLDNGKDVAVTEYTIEKQVAATKVQGMAWLLGWDAGDFQAGAIGWATTERPGLLGAEPDARAWNETQAMLRAADW